MQQPFAIGRSACVLGAFDLGRYWEGLMRGRREVIKVGHMIEEIKVLAFDTFGTVTDWHTGVSRTLSEIFPELDSSMLANQ